MDDNFLVEDIGQACLDRVDLRDSHRARGKNIDLDPAETLLDEGIISGDDSDNVPKPTLCVDHEQEPQDQVIASACEDLPEGLGAVGCREHLRGKKLPKAAVRAGQVEDIFELAEDRLDVVLPAGLVCQFEQAPGIDIGERVGLCFDQGHSKARLVARFSEP